VLVNVTVKQRIDLDGNAAIRNAVSAAESELNGSGRVLLRASGTEPKVRVMVEGRDRVQVEALAERIADTVRVAATAAA
jgi:phosphoglucosamine mutase